MNEDLLKQANKELTKLTNLYNNTPVETFDGLSPDDMFRLLHIPLGEKNSVCKFADSIDNELLSGAYLVTDIKKLLQLIQERQPMELTKAGYLPSVVSKIMAELKMLEDDNRWYQEKKQKVVKETNFHYLALLHLFIQKFGLVRKQKNVLTLTKTAEKFVSTESLYELYCYILTKFAYTFNWGYSDGYPEAWIIQQSWLYSVLLLQKYGGKPTNMDFYEDKFFKAFPQVTEEFQDESYSTKEDRTGICYETRMFRRFLRRFGLITIDPEDMYYRIQNVTKTPLVDKLFHWQAIPL